MPNKRSTCGILALIVGTAVACGKDSPPSSPPDPRPAVQLKDIAVPRLPAPYYHFAYDDSGRIDSVSFASDLTMYDVRYADGRISELHNNILVNHDRLVYVYDDAGRVRDVNYTNSSGTIFTRVHLGYSGNALTTLTRERLANGAFVIDKTMTFAYWPDGNISDVTIHRPAIEGFQPDQTYNDHFDNYDTGINVDGFGLVHDEFSDHLVLLPTSQFQKNNARRVTRTGDADNFRVDYSYTYDNANRPLAKTGDLVFSTGPLLGRHFEDSATYTYYD
ncbi:MAG: hypothetical protein ACJ796_16525 [Gemmatimonadaceae bacterium]